MSDSGTPSRQDLLRVYLNDHLTGAAGGVELFRRAAGTQSRPEARAQLKALTAEVVEDRAALMELMQQLDVNAQPHRMALGWLGEKVGRLKPNGSLIRRTPLTDLVELEALKVGVEGKLACWRTLEIVATSDARIDVHRVQELERRAESQLDQLETLRQAAAASALSG